ncbi:tRNA(fMet)-specific endonuclease VapC [Acaryochloris thomasi RCC1774]|uniref:tRNA(fMet)-specific endonuclease VapC n=1 Tax=Acaryochloris thomasi RCC1774 TaxID=1764569 RepID=A0A2W1JNJ9_9CYAN|nr:type II toxin-antitoxin system VapC family toxin [Acaryochloris thomasi]PZD74869.1 tRNA(fMet)-specific endonuclease VapC [Acaryochloris thomasi RCC1774]
MAYLLDTCVISDFSRGDPNTLQKLKTTPPIEIFISAVTCMEVYYGFKLNPNRAAKIQSVINSLLASVTVLPFDIKSAKQAAHIRCVLKTAGTPIGAYDVLIAATALVHGLTAVTSNVREFQRVSGLEIENWR